LKIRSLVALAATLALSAALSGGAQPAPSRPGRPAKPATLAKPAPPTDWLDIQKWPAYPGAELVQQVSLSGEQLKQLAGLIPPEAQPYLRGLKQAAILSYRLPETVVMKDVIAFYEPRVLASGYKILEKDLSDPGDVSATYVGQHSGTLVVSVESEGDKSRMLEIVSVKGPVGSLAALGKAMKKGGGGSSKPATASPSRKRGTSGTAPSPPPSSQPSSSAS
jgi:hypothetical protein